MAAIIDLYSRMVVGWSMSSTVAKRLVIDALLMAVDRCKPFKNLLLHSDQGSVCPEKVKMFSGSQTHQDKSRSPVARVAMWRETKMLKPTDNVIVG